MTWTTKHLLGVRGLEREQIDVVMELARELSAWAVTGTVKDELAGRTVANLFFEPSTRTRTSFNLAARRLGATVIEYDVAHGSTVKGETTVDTARNLEAMGVDAVVVRSAHTGTPILLSRHLDASVLNAGDGAREHPTQALLDLYTMQEIFGDVDGLEVVIVGDVGSSRVARSNMWLLQTMGAKVTMCGPPTLVPRSLTSLGVRVSSSIDAELERADVVMLLRIQHERNVEGALPSVREFARMFGMNEARAARMKDHAVVMHPGPINRGVELTPKVADSARSTVLRQTRNGVAVRMAVLKLCLEARSNG